jgi:hypothetical protein
MLTLIDVGWMSAGTSLGVVSVGFFAAAIPKNSERAAPGSPAPGGRGRALRPTARFSAKWIGFVWH